MRASTCARSMSWMSSSWRCSSSAMRARRSVNSHDARSMIASARREVRISRSIVSLSTSARPPAGADAVAPWAAIAAVAPCSTTSCSAAATSACHRGACLPRPCTKSRRRCAVRYSAGRSSSLRVSLRMCATTCGKPLTSSSTYIRRASPASGLGAEGLAMVRWVAAAPTSERSTLYHGARVRVVGVVLAARRLHQVLALDAQPHRDRRGHEHRRVDAEQDADRQRDREVVQRRSAEQQHRQHHHLGRAVGDDRAAHRARDRVVDHLVRRELAVLAEGLADPVEDHHRLVDRIAQHRQHRGQHRERELPLEEGEEAEDDDDVVQVGDDRGDRELPLEPEREVEHDADDPPPVSLASQSHHEKPPEVTCTSRGNPGFPASTRERPRETFFNTSRGQIPLPWLGSNDALPLATRMETRRPWRPTRGSLTSPSYLVRNRTLGPPLENNPDIPPSSRDEGLRLLHGLETSLATSLQTPQEA